MESSVTSFSVWMEHRMEQLGTKLGEQRLVSLIFRKLSTGSDSALETHLCLPTRPTRLFALSQFTATYPLPLRSTYAGHQATVASVAETQGPSEYDLRSEIRTHGDGNERLIFKTTRDPLSFYLSLFRPPHISLCQSSIQSPPPRAPCQHRAGLFSRTSRPPSASPRHSRVQGMSLGEDTARVGAGSYVCLWDCLWGCLPEIRT
ncbi:hypothetical protein DFP72DRAFT_53305 [Ephemerocybe angulata]|uniref:Uncharacterized protein n=1 Tax=Ephemerocybe angulata TaxID=980116 RepID=A0A8H6HE01_9AGAR|nr:hypothetical protein DFP72DRAFT_53305 [Tulosesus angulatus]